MAKIYLINVGANTQHENRGRSPIFRDGTWAYVPFPHRKGKEGEDFPPSILPYIRKCDNLKCHLDPDWDRLTYGDSCVEPRGRSLVNVKNNDILLFWALLWKMNLAKSVFETREKGWYLIGALRVLHILRSGDKLNALPDDVRQRAEHNSHVRNGRVGDAKGERVFMGCTDHRHSRRFTHAIDWEVYKDGGLMQHVVRTSKGEKLQWYKQPQWNSCTRSCRAILDRLESWARQSLSLEKPCREVGDNAPTSSCGVDCRGTRSSECGGTHSVARGAKIAG